MHCQTVPGIYAMVPVIVLETSFTIYFFGPRRFNSECNVIVCNQIIHARVFGRRYPLADDLCNHIHCMHNNKDVFNYKGVLVVTRVQVIFLSP